MTPATIQALHHGAEHATHNSGGSWPHRVGARGVHTSCSARARGQHPPHDMEAAKQARACRRAPHNGDIEVQGNGHGPEEGAGVGEGGQGTLQHAVP